MNDNNLWNDWGNGERTEGAAPKSQATALGNDWGDGERTPGVTQQSTRQDTKAFPLGGDWGDGEHKPVEQATPEATSDPIGYLGEIPDSFSEQDVAIVGTFFSGLEGKVTPDVGQELLSRYDAFVQAADEQEAAGDKAARDVAVASLRREWGEDYDTNIAWLHDAMAGRSFKEDLLSARFPDGRAIFNDPSFVAWLIELTEATD